MIYFLVRYEAEPVQDATDNFVGDVGRYPWQKRATSQTSRKAVFAIVAFCKNFILLFKLAYRCLIIAVEFFQWNNLSYSLYNLDTIN